MVGFGTAMELAGTETGADEGTDDGGEERRRRRVLSQAYTQRGGLVRGAAFEAGSVEQGKSKARKDRRSMVEIPVELQDLSQTQLEGF